MIFFLHFSVTSISHFSLKKKNKNKSNFATASIKSFELLAFVAWTKCLCYESA